jgi:hypothetical protein
VDTADDCRVVEVALPALGTEGGAGGRRGGARLVASISSPLLRQASMMCLYH